MHTISIRRFGFALGAGCGLAYLACVFVMLTAPRETVVRFFNSLLHGWNVEPIMRWDMPWSEAIIGTLEVSVLGWFFGALVAMLYNLAARRPRGPQDGAAQ